MNNIKEKKVIIYLIIISMLLIHFSLFFIHFIYQRGTAKRTISSIINFPEKVILDYSTEKKKQTKDNKGKEQVSDAKGKG